MYRNLLLALALLLIPAAAHAGDKPLYQPAPAWVKPAPAIDATHLGDSDPILILFDQQQRLQDGQVWGFFDTATRVATPQMLTQIGTLPLPWDPAKGDLIIHRVEIIRGAEHIDMIAGGARFNVIQREQGLEQAWLNGMLTATLAMEGVRVGDVVHVSFSITRKDPALHGHLQTIAPLLPDPTRLQFGRLRLLWPKAMPLQWRSYLKTDAQPVDTADGWRELVIPLPVAKQAEMPGDAPMRYKPLPLLEATDYASWSDLSKDMALLFRTQGAIAPGSPLAAEVARIAAASPDPRTRAAMALQLVQDKVRYLFRGMDNGDYIPQAPALTWSVRYGDCKAKSLLLLAILRALGIEADAALVSADMGDLVSVRLTAPAAFNHVIVRATIGGETLWLDGTAGGSRATDLNDVPPFRNALPIRETGSELVAMPMRRPARPVTEVALDVDASAGVLLPMIFHIRVETRGGMAEMVRLASMQGDKDRLDALVDAMFVSPYLGTHVIGKQDVKYDEATATTVITAEGIVYSDWEQDNRRYKVQLDKSVTGISFSPDRARAAWRDIPVTTGSPDDTSVRTRILLPGGGTGFALEGDKTLPPSLGGVLLERKAVLDGGAITVDDRVTTGIAEVAPADIPATRGQLAQAKARLLKAVAPADYPAYSAQVEAAKRGKAFAPLFAIYAARIAAKPDEASRYTDRAWFYEAIYDPKGAIPDLDKAIELEPEADTYVRRANDYAALKDDTRAMADLEAALALDPDSTGAIGELAELKARHGKYDDAIAMLDARVALGGKEAPSWSERKATLMAEAGKVAEGIAVLDAAVADTPGNPELLNGRCWLKGIWNVMLDSALKDCTKSIELSDSPSAPLDSRGMVYFRLNRFDDALADFNAALDGDPSSSASLFMRGVIRTRTKAPGAAEDLAAARMINPRVDEEYGRWGIRP